MCYFGPHQCSSVNQIDCYNAHCVLLGPPELASWVNQIDGYNAHVCTSDPHIASWVNQIDGYNARRVLLSDPHGAPAG